MSGYDVIDTLLARAEAESLAAECHGFLCGQICVTGQADEDLWMEFLDVQGDDDEMIRACYAEIRQLAARIMEEMYSEEFGLQLLLPDDDTSMALRVEALVNWCHGFLNGVGVSEGIIQAGMSEECEEILNDFSQICRLGFDEEETEEEQSLMELIEYTRMGAIMIYEELQPAHGRPEVLH